MKIDFYDLFSLHTPKELPETGEGNYITAAVKSRVMENIPAGRSKPVRFGRIGRAVIAAAAAVAVLVTGTLAASAMGLIDLEKVFGGMFWSGYEHLEDISAVPQNVVTTGDDRISMRVLGIGGTVNEAFGTIEIKRNDGGTFPKSISAENIQDFIADPSRYGYLYSGYASGPEVIDETTAIYQFRVYKLSGESILGEEYKFSITNITDFDLASEIAEAEKIKGRKLNTEEPFVTAERDVIMEGEWSISFPLDYETDYRTIAVNQPLYNNDSYPFITEIGYSSISLDIFFDRNPYSGAYDPENVSVKLDNGKNVQFGGIGSTIAKEGEKPSVHYSFLNSVDIDSIETITIGDIVIDVK